MTSSSAHDDRFLIIEAGFSGDLERATSGLTHSDEDVRASALRSLHRMSSLSPGILKSALIDSSATVRRTAVELSTSFAEVDICPLINDSDVFVCEMTAWALGERETPTDSEVETLIHSTLHHPEMVVREASAASLGSLGDPRGLPAILTACSDKPAVRRRAILALAPFEGDDVESALRVALEDNDWQVRQNAEILLHPRD